MRHALLLQYALRESIDPETLVDPDNLDLAAEYRALNRKLFDGKLGNYPMKWNRRKGTFARVVIRGKRGQPSTYVVTRIEFSQLYEMTYRQFINRLAHEMVHVKIAESGAPDFGGYHGLRFQAEARRLNAMGYEVTKQEDLPPGTRMRVSKAKQLVAILFERAGSKGALVALEKHWRSLFDQLASLPAGWLERHNVYFVLTSHPELQHMPFSRKVPSKGFRWYLLPDGVWDNIRREGKLLGSIVQGKRQPPK